MSYRMAIDHSDVLAGIVVIGGISYKDKNMLQKIQFMYFMYMELKKRTFMELN